LISKGLIEVEAAGGGPATFAVSKIFLQCRKNAKEIFHPQLSTDFAIGNTSLAARL
jgi:hypothetical protein